MYNVHTVHALNIVPRKNFPTNVYTCDAFRKVLKTQKVFVRLSSFPRLLSALTQPASQPNHERFGLVSPRPFLRFAL